MSQSPRRQSQQSQVSEEGLKKKKKKKKKKKNLFFCCFCVFWSSHHQRCIVTYSERQRSGKQSSRAAKNFLFFFFFFFCFVFLPLFFSHWFFLCASGFRPGAIVRVTLKDFMTYSAGELRPGPRLNVVLGPNGTGKSSIVCGIGLALAGKPKILGRAKTVGSFVRSGQVTFDKRSVGFFCLTHIAEHGVGGSGTVQAQKECGDQAGNFLEQHFHLVLERPSLDDGACSSRN